MDYRFIEVPEECLRDLSRLLNQNQRFKGLTLDDLVAFALKEYLQKLTGKRINNDYLPANAVKQR
jgi:DNA-binding protein Fis